MGSAKIAVVRELLGHQQLAALHVLAVSGG